METVLVDAVAVDGSKYAESCRARQRDADAGLTIDEWLLGHGGGRRRSAPDFVGTGDEKRSFRRKVRVSESVWVGHIRVFVPFESAIVCETASVYDKKRL